MPLNPFPHNTHRSYYRLFLKVFCSNTSLHISLMIFQQQEKNYIKGSGKKAQCNSTDLQLVYFFHQCLDTPTATGITLDQLQLNMTLHVKLSTANAFVIASRTTCSMTSFLMYVSILLYFLLFLAQTLYMANIKHLFLLYFISKASRYYSFLNTVFSSSSA